MSARLTAFSGLGALSRLGARAVRLCEYVGVALLSRGELMAGAARAWEPFNRSPVALSAELFEWERAALDRLLGPGQAVLVVGCGAGRELLALLARGLVVDGLDIAPQAVAKARERVTASGFESTLIVAALEDEPALPRAYDLVIFSWFCFSYVPDRRYRLRALAAAARALRPGGRLMLSYIPQRMRGADRAVRVAGLAARLVGSDWQPEPGDELMMPAAGMASYQRLFRPEGLVAEIEQAGLRVIRHEIHESGGIVVAAPVAIPGERNVTQATSAVDSIAGAP
ncbi:MAG: methyltransferase domain-containing protein [Vicinamibacteria bacterium]|nr:methyltransferase domain-containing protein [Vicinamibacteria bacterium]